MSIQTKVGWRSFVANNQTGIDTDAQAFITAASITDSTQQSAINTLVTQLKGYGIWTKLKAVYPFVGGNASAHKFNLKDPRDLDVAFRLTFNGGWTHSSTGAQPNGTTGYANTFFIPNTQTQYNQHLSYYTTNNGMALSGRFKAWLGAYHTSWETGYTGLKEFYIGANNTLVCSIQYSETNVNNFVKKSETSPIGFWTGTRLTSGLDLRLFKNGTKVDTITASPASQYQPDHNTYLGAMHVKYVGQDYADNFSDNNTAFASIGDGLSDTEAANFYTAVQTFQTTLGRQVGVPIVADTDAQAFLNAAVITDSTQASAITTLVTDLKSAGIWTKLKAVYPFVGGTAEQHRFNLKNPVIYKLTFGGGWAHSSTGALPNGTTAYADTQLPPSLVLSVNNAHTSIYVNNNPVAYTSHPSFGCMDVTNNTKTFYTNLVYSNNYYSFIGDEKGSATYGVTYNNTDSKGFYLASRTSSTMLKGYKNAVLKATNTLQNTGTLPTTNYYYGGVNNGTVGMLSLTYNNYSHAFASIGDGLSDADATALYTAVQTFQSTLGRQVGVPIVADTDAQAFLNAAEITSQTQASAVNTLVTDLKSAGIWTKLKAVYPFVGGTATSHKFNLKDPRDLDAAYRLQFYGGGTHGSNGFLQNYVNSWADTKFTPSNNFSSASKASFGIYSRTLRADNNRIAMGSNSGTGWIFIWLRNGNSTTTYVNSNFPAGSAHTTAQTNTTKGFFQSARNNSTTEQLLNVNNVNYSSTANSSSLSTNSIFIGSINGLDSGQYVDNLEIAFAYIGDDLSPTDLTNYYTAVQKYQTSLGRQV